MNEFFEETKELNEEIYPDNLNHIVTIDIGGLKKGDSIKGLTISKIIEKICCYNPLKTQIEYLNLLDIPKLWNNGYTGKGVKIGLFGSGIATNDSIANVKKYYSAVKKQEITVATNINGHDVGVLSNIASKKYGIAYDADIYISDMEITNLVDMPEDIVTERFKNSIDWFISQGVDMISASITFNKVKRSVFIEAMEKLITNNIIFIAAIGNGRGYGNPCENISYYNVINIGAVDKDKIATDFQTLGEFMTFTCFGKNVPGYSVNLGEVFNDGTSFSTAYAAGIIACLIQQGKEKGIKLTFRQIRDIIACSSEHLGESGKNDKYGYGLIKATLLPESIKSDDTLREEENKILANINYSLPKDIYIGERYNINFYITPSIINYRKVNVNTSTMDLIDIEKNNYDFIVIPKEVGDGKINITLESGEESNIEVSILKTIETTIEDCKKFYGVDIVNNAGFYGEGIKIAYCCSGADLSEYTSNIKGGKKFNESFGDIYIEGSKYKDATACISVLNYMIPKAEVYVLKVKNDWGGLSNEAIENSLYEYILANNFDIVVWDYILQSYDSEVKSKYLDRINDSKVIQIRNSLIALNAPQTINRDDFIAAQVIGAPVYNHKNAIVSEELMNIPYFDAINKNFNFGTKRAVKNQPWVLIAIVALYKNQNKDLNTEEMKKILINNAEKLPGQTAFDSNYKNGLVKANILK